MLDGIHDDPDRITARLQPLGGTVLKTNLTPDAEAKLQAALRPVS
jgi:uncharacterized membrane protein